MNASEIRNLLEGLPCPFYTKGFSDERLLKILKEAEDTVKHRFDVSDIDFKNEDMDDAWWEELERECVAQGMPYCEDIDDE